MHNKNYFYLYSAFVFSYTLFISFGFQFFLLPQLQSINYGHGLIIDGDWTFFHETAYTCSKLISDSQFEKCRSLFQWQPFLIYPSFIYYYTGVSEPWVLIPFNSLIFTGSALFLLRIFYKIFDIKRAIIGTIPFVMFPSALILYGQIHKDIFSIFGVYIIINTLIPSKKQSGTSRSLSFEKYNVSPKPLLLLFIGVCFLDFVRPYLMPIILLICFFLALIFLKDIRHKITILFSIIICYFLFSLFSDALVDLIGPIDYSNKLSNSPIVEVIELKDYGIQTKFLDGSNSIKFHDRLIITYPDGFKLIKFSNGDITAFDKSGDRVIFPNINRFFYKIVGRISSARSGFAKGYSDAKSNIDTNIEFKSLDDILMYVPRAAQISIFAPFPTTWFSHGKNPASIYMKSISAIEMIFSYFSCLGLILILLKYKTEMRNFLIAISICFFLLIVLGLVVCNIGTLYRMRYPYWQLINGFGLIGLIMFIKKSKN
jgi:hypothetical protein